MKTTTRCVFLVLLILSAIGALAQEGDWKQPMCGQIELRKQSAPETSATITPAQVQIACMHGLRGCWQATEQARQQAPFVVLTVERDTARELADLFLKAADAGPTGTVVTANMSIDRAQTMLVALNYALGINPVQETKWRSLASPQVVRLE